MRVLSILFIVFFTFSSNIWAQSITLTPDGNVEQRGLNNAELNLYGNSAAVVNGTGFRGTLESPEPVSNGAFLFRVDAKGYDGINYTSQRAGVRFMATENWEDGKNGTSIRFLTTKNSTAGVGTKMILDDKGYLGIGSFGNLTNPDIEEKLHIEHGDALIEDTNPFLFFKTSGTSGTGNAGINFQNSLKQTRAVINYNHVDDAIRIVNGSSTSDGIYVTSTSSDINMVGIGLNDPSGKLHVKSNGSGSSPQLVIEENNGSDYGRINFNNSTTSELWTLAGKSNDLATSSFFNIYSSQYGNVATFYGTGDTKLRGFTQLGETAPKIKMVKLTGTTSSSSSTSIAHNSSIGKVLDAKVFVYYTPLTKIPPGHSSSIFSYDIEVSGSNITLSNVSSGMQSKSYELLLTIEE